MSDQKDIFGRASVSKVEAYNWQLVDKPGHFKRIDKLHLNVDHTYQRDNICNARVNAIAARWSWSACGCLLVARRPDNTFWVFDGQHRKLAADKRSDITRLPCLVFDIASTDCEATAFLDANTARGPVSRYHVFRAQLVKRDPDALAVEQLILSTKHKIGKNTTRGVRCIGLVLDEYKKNPEIAASVWRLAVRICDDEPINNKLYGGLCYLERWLKRQSLGSLADPQNAEKLAKHSQSQILKKIGAAVANNNKGGAAVYAEGIRSILNHGRRTKLLPSILTTSVSSGDDVDGD